MDVRKRQTCLEDLLIYYRIYYRIYTARIYIGLAEEKGKEDSNRQLRFWLSSWERFFFGRISPVA